MADIVQDDSVTGVLLVGHGTRSEVGRRQFLNFAERLQKAVAPAAVEPAFLELAEPAIDEAVGRLVERGMQRLVTLPLLLFAAGHAKEDVPRTVDEALARRGLDKLPRAQGEPLGGHPAIVELSRLRMEKRVSKAMPEPTVLLLVGRGSRDESATAEMYEFARHLATQTGLQADVAFLAMARPLLREQLAALAAREPPCVVVQPHLLFHGDLVEALTAQVVETRAMYPRTQWEVTSLLADELGSEGAGNRLLEVALLSRLREALIRVVAVSGDD